MINPVYSPAADRYENGMNYRRSGRSGVFLPEISLGLWHNFGAGDPLSRSREILRYAFDHGITHFDLANNYGPPYGSAEQTFGEIFRTESARCEYAHEYFPDFRYGTRAKEQSRGDEKQEY